MIWRLGSSRSSGTHVIIGAPRIRDTIRAAMERDTGHEQIISEQSIKHPGSSGLHALARVIIIGKVSIDIPEGLITHSLFSLIVVITRSVGHRRNYDLSGRQ